MTNNKLSKVLGIAWDVVADNDVSVKEVLNALTEEIVNNITLNEGELLYTNVYWHDNVDLDSVIEDVISMFKDLKIKNFAALDSGDYSATAVAIIYTGGKK